jgi:ADP-ribose pyrophosphatase
METLLECRKFKVIGHSVRARDGRMVRREIIVHPGAVVILPILPDGRFVLVRVMRHTLDRELLELPAGTLDRPGEDPPAAAHRELEEETGYRAGRMEPLCEFYPSPGVMTELIRAFVATDLTKTAQRLDETEQIRVEIMPADAALAAVDSGEIRDAKTMITLMRWQRKGAAR